MPTAGLARKNQDAYRTSRPIPCGWSMCDIRVYFLARKNHKMHIAHLARFRSVGRCPCGKQHFREIATPDWVRTLRTCKQTHACARFVNWLTKSGVAISRKCCFPHGTTCIIAHRPIRFARRCAIFCFVSLGQKNHNMHHRTSTDSIRPSMCDILVLYLLARKITTSMWETTFPRNSHAGLGKDFTHM